MHPGDERHLAGAFQDNRVIPVEGVRVAELSEEARARTLDVVAAFVRLLPEGPRAARLREVEAHLDETWFSWIGGHEPGDVSYYRVQSPVVIAELDHHGGVFLDYDTPQPFHVHTGTAHPRRAQLPAGVQAARGTGPDRAGTVGPLTLTPAGGSRWDRAAPLSRGRSGDVVPRRLQ